MKRFGSRKSRQRSTNHSRRWRHASADSVSMSTSLKVESLEPRLLLSIVAPTDYDQYTLELINRGRNDPAAEAALYSIALNEGVPLEDTISTDAKQPLAFSGYINDAAQDHSQWMLDTDTFSHTGNGGTSPHDRMVNAGYSFVPSWSSGERSWPSAHARSRIGNATTSGP